MVPKPLVGGAAKRFAWVQSVCSACFAHCPVASNLGGVVSRQERLIDLPEL